MKSNTIFPLTVYDIAFFKLTKKNEFEPRNKF